MVKLTKAQRELLIEASDECGTFCAHSYRPAAKLVSLSLAVWEDGDSQSDWLNITDAGRAALADGGRPHEQGSET